MRRLWIVSALAAAFTILTMPAISAQAQNLSMPCSTAGEFCGRLVSPECLDKVGAGSTGVEGAAKACDANLALYRDCLATVAASCTGGAEAGAPASAQSALRSADGPAQTIAMDNGDEVALYGCASEGPFVTCTLTIKVKSNRSIQFCNNFFGLVLASGDQLNAETVLVGGKGEGVICPSQQFFAIAPPARFEVKFKTSAAGQAAQLIAFRAVLFDSVIVE